MSSPLCELGCKCTVIIEKGGRRRVGWELDMFFASFFTSCKFCAISLFHTLQTDLNMADPAANPTPALATPNRPQKIIGSMPLRNKTIHNEGPRDQVIFNGGTHQ